MMLQMEIIISALLPLLLGGMEVGTMRIGGRTQVLGQAQLEMIVTTLLLVGGLRGL